MSRAKIPFFTSSQLVNGALIDHERISSVSSAQLRGTPVRIYDRSSGNFKAIGWRIPILFFRFGRFSEVVEVDREAVSIILD